MSLSTEALLMNCILFPFLLLQLFTFYYNYNVYPDIVVLLIPFQPVVASRPTKHYISPYL